MTQLTINEHRMVHPGPKPMTDPVRLHRRLPGFHPTPLRYAPAGECAPQALMIKLETNRCGLPAFKVLGASWAIYRRLEQALGITLQDWQHVDELQQRLRASLADLSLVSATDGNHGRGVARMARWLDVPARIYMPGGTVPARIEAIRAEGATVSVVDGSYDIAVQAARDDVAANADDNRTVSNAAWLIQDTSWPGYEAVPRDVIDGYTTMMWEIDESLDRDGRSWPDVVFVQLGVGSLAVAVINHLRHAAPKTVIIGVEPTAANCVQRSLLADGITSAPGPHDSIMAGLNCDTPASIAWPVLRGGLDAVVSIDDDDVVTAMRRLHTAGMRVGESGAAGLAGLIALNREASPAERGRLRLSNDASVMILATEGVTDPEAYDRIIGESARTQVGHE